jgi:hypothetical protein
VRRRPLFLVVIGLVEALAPLWTWLQLAAFNGVSPLAWRAVLGAVNAHAVAIALGGLAAGVGLLSFRRWGYQATELFCAAAIVNNVALLAIERRAPPILIGAMTAATVGALMYLRRPEIRALFRSPRLHWWKAEPRWRARVAATVELPDAGPVSGEALDISSGGAFIAAPCAARPGARCSVVLPGARGGVRSSGEVAWVSRGLGRHPAGFGVRFVRPPAPFRRAVRRLRSESEGPVER